MAAFLYSLLFSLRNIWQQYRKSIISFVAFVVIFLLLRYAPLQESYIFPVPRFTNEQKNNIKQCNIPDLSDKSLASKPNEWHYHSFVIHENGKADIQGYIWVNSFNRLNRKKSASGSLKKVILRFRGNAEHLPRRSTLLQYQYLAHPYDVIEMDYPGTGASDGQIRSEQDLVAFAQRCYEYVVRQGYDEIILEGTSLGTFCASRVAADNWDDPKIKMLIMDAGFAALHYIQGIYLAPLLWLIFRYRLDNIKNLAKVTCPIFIRHGTHDRLVFYINGRWLYNSVQSRKNAYFFPHKGGHYPNNPEEADARARHLLKMLQLYLQKA